jgi:membrane fusion protein (multidrug efflux system)
VIPEEAIVPQGGKQFVIKVVNGTTPNSRISQRAEVKLGLRSPGKVEVLEGLEPGDSVVTAGQQRVQRDGTEVRVLDVAAAAVPGAPASGAPAAGAPAPGAPAKPAADAKPAAKGKPNAEGKSGNSKAVAAVAPLVGPDPCLAGVEDAAPRGGARPSAAPGRKPVSQSGTEALRTLAPA